MSALNVCHLLETSREEGNNIICYATITVSANSHFRGCGRSAKQDQRGKHPRGRVPVGIICREPRCRWSTDAPVRRDCVWTAPRCRASLQEAVATRAATRSSHSGIARRKVRLGSSLLTSRQRAKLMSRGEFR